MFPICVWNIESSDTMENFVLETSLRAYQSGQELAQYFEKVDPEFVQPLDHSLKKQFQIELLSYLLYLSETKRTISPKRTEYINAVFDTTYRAEDLMELSRRLSLHYSDFSSLVPLMLKAAARIDRMHPQPTSYKDQIIQIFTVIGENIAAYSNEKNALEELDRQIYLLSLQNWAHDQNVPYVNPLNSSRLSNLDQSKPIQSQDAMQMIKEQDQKEVPEEKEPEKLEDLLAELNELTGLQSVKEDVNSLINLLKIRKIRKERNMKDIPVSMHLVFTGNPGTGKTTVARLLARIYHSLGALSKGQLVEVDRSELVGGYVGQTALKTQEVTNSALGGVLFIDEAYALTAGKHKEDFGYEAVDTLLVEMENHREDLAVIVAGYPKPMKQFLSSNPGLKSRFNKFIDFPDYTPEELFIIFEGMCSKNGYILSEAAKTKAKAIFKDLYDHRDENFANGRTVRNFFEKVMTKQANRLASLQEISDEQLQTLDEPDLPEDFRQSTAHLEEENKDDVSVELNEKVAAYHKAVKQAKLIQSGKLALSDELKEQLSNSQSPTIDTNKD